MVDVLGDIMLVGITVLIAGVLALSIVFLVDPSGTPITDVSVTSTSDTLTIAHTGGDAVSTSTGAFVLRVDGTQHRIQLSACSAAGAGEPGLWEVGESLTIASPSGSCTGVPSGEITELSVVRGDAGDELVFAVWRGSVTT